MIMERFSGCLSPSIAYADGKVLRGTVKRFHKDESPAGDKSVSLWGAAFLSSTPRGRLQIVEALNSTQEFIEVYGKRRQAVEAMLLACARAVRQRDPAAARLLRALPASPAARAALPAPALAVLARAAGPAPAR